VQYDGMMVSDLLKEKGDKMLYRYDFGDDWKHTLELEESLTPEMGMDYRVLPLSRGTGHIIHSCHFRKRIVMNFRLLFSKHFL